MFLDKDFSSILELLEAFPTNDSCVEHLETIKWDGDVISPFNGESKVYVCKGNKYKCKESGKYFNVKTGTIFEDTKIPLRKWFVAIYLAITHKKGISSYQLAKDVGVTQKTAWFMLQRIRVALGEVNNDEDLMDGIVEADETFVGGKNKNRHKDKKVEYSQGRSFKDKTPVLGLLQRAEIEVVERPHKIIPDKMVQEKVVKQNSKLKAFAVTDTKRKTIQPLIFENVELDSRFMSDEWHAYKGLKKLYNHSIVDHSKKEYVNLDDNTIHTNTIEGAWSHLKRTIIGTYHSTSRKHLQKYVNGFVFRYNCKLKSNKDIFNLMLQYSNIRLKYKDLTI